MPQVQIVYHVTVFHIPCANALKGKYENTPPTRPYICNCESQCLKMWNVEKNSNNQKNYK